MAYTSLQVANEFLKLARDDREAAQDISNMKLQKLVFFAQLLSVCMNIEQPLVSSHFHAWDFGPVSPLLYKKIKRFGANFLSLSNPEVASVFADCEPISEPWALGIIHAVWRQMKMYTSVQLSQLSHRKGSPWEIVYNANRYGIIPNTLMAEKKFGDEAL
ncbi:MAG: DUF4065 domain-containing protein [Lentisphaeraceae bacterium]|nr:DUF4065 domain-containing protein [Lentisphaeraceae bacterium]